MEPTTRKVVHRSPSRTARRLHLPMLQPEPIEADSSVERDFVYVAALFSRTKKIVHQPFRLVWPDQSYTPDFLLEFDDGSRIVVEVKPETKVAAHAELHSRASAKLTAHGMHFLVANDTVLRRDGRAERAAVIRRYAKSAVDPDQMSRVMEIIRGNGGQVRIGHLLERGLTRSTIYQLICKHEIQPDAALSLSVESSVCLVQPEVGENHAIQFVRWLDL